MNPTTLRGGTYRTPPEIWRDLPDDGTRRDEYLRRYLARWRRMNPRYSAVKNREWRAKTFGGVAEHEQTHRIAVTAQLQRSRETRA